MCIMEAKEVLHIQGILHTATLERVQLQFFQLINICIMIG